ncbi:unnamed protein product [Spirodela intermedia]|uniref:Uncharacterized protein n=1 Tax=Spirodela intermedia TaxID=51605 RepID=A0A7I8IC74_SPIIN|nr:unnamed protein product [Spirodela intermedia]CAA6655387.1 unnamed protein product [Spirodela intermedia]
MQSSLFSLSLSLSLLRPPPLTRSPCSSFIRS